MNLLSHKDTELIGKIITYIKPYKFGFIFIFLCITLNILIGLAYPVIWGKFITLLISKDFKIIIEQISYLLSLSIALILLEFIQSTAFTKLSNNIAYDLKANIYEKILDLPVKAFDDNRVGDFISRLQGDVSAIVNFTTNDLVTILLCVLRVIGIGFITFKTNYYLALIIILSFPISYFVFLKFGYILRKLTVELLKLNDHYYSYIQQSFAGIREIKNLGIEGSNLASFLKLSKKLKSKKIMLNRKTALSHGLSELSSSMSRAMIMIVGVIFIINGSLKIEYFIAFMTYSRQFSNSLLKITQMNAQIQKVLVSLERVFELLNNLNYPPKKFGVNQVKNVNGRIVFSNVSFSYDGITKVLDNISFAIQANKKIAIVGPSGSGKSTIFNLLLRFYEISVGEITIDNIALKNFSKDSLRYNISFVRQEPFLFNLSIKENFLLVNPHVTDEQIIEICTLTHIHNDIIQLPRQYDTIIGENGINLSVGQKQRLAISRILLRNSKIILFDEATSSLDNRSQEYIKNTIDALSQNHTILIIAHRLSTIIEADQIIVIDKGKVVGSGTHDYLIKNNPTYRDLYQKELIISNEN